MNRLAAPVRQNLIASTVLGPLRSLVPAVLAVLLYPMLLHAGGLELVGIWAVLQLVVSYLAQCAGGLPFLVMRRVAATDAGADEPIRIVLGAYLLGGMVLLATTFALARPVWRLMQLPPQPNVVMVLVTTALAGSFANIGSIYAAVISGLHRSYLVQLAETLGAISQFLVAAAFIFLGHATLGLALALLAGKATILAIVAPATKRQVSADLVIRPRLHLGRFIKLLAEAKGFILLSMGNALLEPIVRAILVVMAGPSELGLFDIANRVPMLIRNAFTNGLVALFPAVTALQAQQRLAGIEQVLRVSIGVVVFLIIAPLAAYIILAKPILVSWLGDVGSQVSTITVVVTAWWIVTAYNIPFYLTIQALGHESVVARNVWLHIGLIALGGAGLRWWAGIDAMTVSYLVLVTGIVCQIQLYVEGQRRARLLSIAFANPRERIVVAATLVLLAGSAWLRVDSISIATESTQLFGASAGFLAILLIILGLFTRGRPLRFLTTLRMAPGPSYDS